MRERDGVKDKLGVDRLEQRHAKLDHGPLLRRREMLLYDDVVTEAAQPDIRRSSTSRLNCIDSVIKPGSNFIHESTDESLPCLGLGVTSFRSQEAVK